MKLSGILAEKGLHAFDSEPSTHQGHSVPRIWIVVADSVRAHIFRKTPHGFETIAEAKTGHSQGTHETSQGDVFHGYDVKSRNHNKGDGAFIEKLATWLDIAEREHVYDRLILVAAPRTLGDMRESLSKNVFSRIIAEVDKELTEMPEAKVKKHLNEIVWF
ncbi:MAG: host attachment protein [Alphaproteobacteria bacterium]|nr:MAG: host attachment protein [Alphaproteobacteria bacterium]